MKQQELPCALIWSGFTNTSCLKTGHTYSAPANPPVIKYRLGITLRLKAGRCHYFSSSSSILSDSSSTWDRDRLESSKSTQLEQADFNSGTRREQNPFRFTVVAGYSRERNIVSIRHSEGMIITARTRRSRCSDCSPQDRSHLQIKRNAFHHPVSPSHTNSESDSQSERSCSQSHRLCCL